MRPSPAQREEANALPPRNAVARTVSIDAVPQAVWDTVLDVAGWPRWATYMKSLRREDSGPYGLGARVRVTPRGMPGSIWTVTEYEPPRSHVWQTRLGPGLGLIGGHRVEPRDGGSTVTFFLATSGPLGLLLSPVLNVVFRRNTRLATEGLKHHCEMDMAAP
jgi:hypothetical protein